MADEDMRRWSLRNAAGEISSNNIPTALLIQWANQGIVQPGFTISTDGEVWLPAEMLPDLGMTWYIRSAAHLPYGPITRLAAERLMAQGHFAPDAELTQDPGDEPLATELPVVDESVLHRREAELDEMRQRMAMMEKELRAKDRRISDLQAKLAAGQQEELNVEGRPDVATLSAELAAAYQRLESQEAASQQALREAQQSEYELRQRIHTLEVALEAKKNAPQTPPMDVSSDVALYTILTKEAEFLRKAKEEEEALFEKLREMMKARTLLFGERLLDIRKLMGEGPEQMRDTALRNSRIATLALRNAPNDRAYELEKNLSEALAREADLRQRLMTLETREHELRTQIGQAEDLAQETTRLNEKLRETASAFDHECRARAEEHQEFMHIQEQLLRRIEELERASGAVPQPHSALSMDVEPIKPQRTSAFSWLHQK